MIKNLLFPVLIVLTSVLAAQTCTYTSSLPFLEDFDEESLGISGVPFNFVALPTPGGFGRWSINEHSPYLDAGPDADASGDGNYVYSWGDTHTGNPAILIPPCFDLTSAANPQLRFAYHIYSSGTNRVIVQIKAFGTTDTLLQFDGSQQTGAFDSWKYADIDLTAYSGEIVQLEFVVQKFGFTSIYCAFDEINIFNANEIDVSPIAINYPKQDTCDFGATENVAVTIENTGYLPAIDFDVCYNFDGPTGLSSICETYFGTLLPGETVDYNFTSTLDMSAGGDYELSVFTVLFGDDLAENDTTSASYNLNFTTLPVQENFNSYATGVTDLGPPFFNSDQDLRDFETYPPAYSSFTGLSSPATDRDGDGQYARFYDNSSTFAYLETTCLDLSDDDNPLLEFWFHMLGDEVGRLEVLAINGAESILLGELVGARQLNWYEDFKVARFLTESVANKRFRLRFAAKAGPGTTPAFQGNICIDDVIFRNIEPLDVGIGQWETGDPLCDDGSSTIISAQIRNFGLDTVDMVPVSLEIDGGTPINEIVTEVIPPGEVVLFTFSATANVSSPGVHTLKLRTELLGDTYDGNDESEIEVETRPHISAYPYNQNFDSWATTPAPNACYVVLDGYVHLDEGWSNVSTTSPWSVNSGETPTSTAGPIADHTSGSGNYIFDEGNCFGGEAIVQTPCFDLSSLANPQMAFYYNMRRAEGNSLRVEVSEGDEVWNTIYEIPGGQGNNWKLATIDLTPWLASNVIFRFKSDANYSLQDWAIDDFYIGEPNFCGSAVDLAVEFVAPNKRKLTWTEVGSAIGYEVTLLHPTSASTVAIRTSATFLDVTLPLSGTYEWNVRTKCTAGVSARSKIEDFYVSFPRLAETALKLYPNPASRMVRIEHEATKGSLSLYSATGVLLQSEAFVGPLSTTWQLEYPAGMYFVEIAHLGGTDRMMLVIE